MKLSTILVHIDNGHMALPEFQRGYVWNRDKVRGLMQSLYRGYPVGSLLVWATGSDDAEVRGDQTPAVGVVKLLLDGQQRITSLYGIIRGKAPAFFDGNAQAFTGLYFHVGNEAFEFYSAQKMEADPLWVDVTAVMKGGIGGLSSFHSRLLHHSEYLARIMEFAGRLTRLLAIVEADFHIEEVTDALATGGESPIDVVV